MRGPQLSGAVDRLRELLQCALGELPGGEWEAITLPEPNILLMDKILHHQS